MVEIRQSNLPKHSAKQLPRFKSGFGGRKNFSNSAKGLQDAIAAWKDLMRAALDDKLQTIDSPGVNIFKQGQKNTRILSHWRFGKMSFTLSLIQKQLN